MPGRMVSHVPELLEVRGWGAMDLVRAGFGVDTAYRLADGDTNFTINSLQKLCEIFEVPVERIVEFQKDGSG